MKLGLDLGSKSIHYVLLDGQAVQESGSVVHNGRILDAYNGIVDGIEARHGAVEFYGLCGDMDMQGVEVIHPVVAAVEANRFLGVGARTILSIGCERYYLILLDGSGNYVEHSINSDCAAGTGGFIDQQAERIGCSTSELAEKAFVYGGGVPAIATRCAVFAKTDIIHAQARGFSKEAIACGICEGVARSVLENCVKGRKLETPLLLTGGVALNRKIAAEVEKALSLRAKPTEYAQVWNALGSAVLGKEKSLDIGALLETMKASRKTRERLTLSVSDYPDFAEDETRVEDGVEITVYKAPDRDASRIWLGMDIGSTSTKLVALDETGAVLAGLYTRTKGDPVAAASLLLQKTRALFAPAALEILGLETTGSGRLLVKEVLGADEALNEISAHAYGAFYLDPETDTIIEIGGQDSKFTLLSRGQVIHTAMNYVCAAGTGSFIEEQASRLGISLDDICGMAQGSTAPYTSDRCTVYMERDLSTLLSEGWSREQIIAAVLFSVRDNYLSKVAGKTPLGDRIYFQGATARNKALVSVFEDRIGKPIHVSKFCHLTGALGAAVHRMRRPDLRTVFGGMDFRYTVEAETCVLCANRCELAVYEVGGRKAAWGLKCGREYSEARHRKLSGLSVIEKKRLEIFDVPGQRDAAAVKNSLLIGLPTGVYMEEYAPLFELFFGRLGVRTLCGRTSAAVIREGREIVNSDFCAPMNVIHGQVKDLLDRGCDYVFYPSVLNEEALTGKTKREPKMSEKAADCYFCYYSVYGPAIIKNLSTIDIKDRILSPLIKFNVGGIGDIAENIARTLEGIVPATQEETATAFRAAHADFTQMRKRWENYGTGVLNEGRDELQILLLGRPYAVFDAGLNSGIPEKIERMGHGVIHQSMFREALSSKGGLAELLSNRKPLPEFMRAMHWNYGQEILFMRTILEKHENVYPVFVTCFRCSPDAYIITYLKEIMRELGRPYLVIQLDEHGSDVGYQTRIEAGLESFRNHRALAMERKRAAVPKGAVESLVSAVASVGSAVGGAVASVGKAVGDTLGMSSPARPRIGKDDIIVMSEISPIMSELIKMTYEVHGYRCEVIRVTQRDINEGYLYASGGECLPNVAILGSLINAVKDRKLDPERCIFPFSTACIPCNFSQFTVLTKLAFEKAGLKAIRVAAGNIVASDIEMPVVLYIEQAAMKIITGILYKLFFRHSANEAHRGDARKALAESFAVLRRHLEKNKELLGKAHLLLDSALFFAVTRFDLGEESDETVYPIRKALRAMARTFHPGKELLAAAYEIRALFEKIPLTNERKPRIALTGDLYVKWNSVLNEDICGLVEDLGGEILLPSFTEYAAGLLRYDIRDKRIRRTFLQQIAVFEHRFETVFSGMIDRSFEPDAAECDKLAREYGIDHYIPGETEINVGRVLYMTKHGLADAFLHLNPLFCCPGAVSSSIFRKIQKDLQVPIIDIFYDGTNRPNKIIVPHMYYLARNRLK